MRDKLPFVLALLMVAVMIAALGIAAYEDGAAWYVMMLIGALGFIPLIAIHHIVRN